MQPDLATELIAVETLAGDPAIRHGFFGRRGGVSTGLYAGLNCGFGSADDPAAVTRNRARVAEALGVARENLVTCNQIHSADIVTVSAPWSRERSPNADGMATRQAGVALGILAADCAPVLFADVESRVIGAAHAGWRGALGGVLEATLEAMVALGAARNRIRAAIGPCIAQSSYEVGPEFPKRFFDQDAANAAFFVAGPRAGHHLFDLPGYIVHRLSRNGIARVAAAGFDTVSDPDRFFSYRRACLRGEGDYGRALAAITIAA